MRAETRTTSRDLSPAVAAAVVLAARIPFLTLGCGLDPDGWRAFNSARHLWLTGTWAPSRFPGFPVPEILSAPLAAAGPWAMSAAAALMSALAAGAFVRWFLQQGSREGIFAAGALALAPALAIASCSGLDYAWGLAFLLLALTAAQGGRPLLAGALLGLATGCRLTTILGAIPLGLLLGGSLATGSRVRGLIRFALGLTAVSCVCYAPLWTRYGLSFLHGTPVGYPGCGEIAVRATEGVWGRVGLVGFILAISWHAGRKLRGAAVEPALTLPRHAFAAGLAGLAVFLTAYVAVPLEAGYLVPAIPFALLLAAGVLERPAFRALCVLVMLSSFVSFGRSGVYPGPLLADAARRAEVREDLARASARIEVLDHPSVVVAGLLHPELLGRLPTDGFRATFDPRASEANLPMTLGRVRIAYTLSREAVMAERAAGRAIYFLEGQDAYNERATGFDLTEAGARPLDP